jgi:hypothetical protein
MFKLENKARIELLFLEEAACAEGAACVQSIDDTLFWSVFAAHHGHEALAAISSKYKNRELEEKTEIADAALARRDAFKACVPPMSRVAVAAAAAGLMVDPRTDLAALPLLAAHYGTRIRVVDARRNTYLDIDPPGPIDSPPVAVVRRAYHGRTYAPVWKSVAGTGPDAGIAPAMFRLESIAKPLRAISTYTAAEIRGIASFFDIALDAKAKKREVYDAVSAHCVPDADPARPARKIEK